MLTPKYNPQKRSRYVKMILREAENLFRESANLQRVGEGWISETLLYERMKAAFPDSEVKQHASPAFLQKQHYDVYFPKHRIALEYQGAQHFQAIAFFGGEKSLEDTKARDMRKKALSNQNGITQIDVLPDYNLEVLIKDIAKAMGGDFKIKDAIIRAQKITKNTTKNHKGTAKKSITKANQKIKEQEQQERELKNKMQLLLSQLPIIDKPYDALRAGIHIEDGDFDEIIRRQEEERSKFAVFISRYDKACKLSKTDPEKSNEQVNELINEGYVTPAAYCRLAINYHKLKQYDKELDVLLYAKRVLNYDFDERIIKVIRLVDEKYTPTVPSF